MDIPFVWLWFLRRFDGDGKSFGNGDTWVVVGLSATCIRSSNVFEWDLCGLADVDGGDFVASNCLKRVELRDWFVGGIGLDAVVYISLFEKSNDVGSTNCLLADDGGDDGKREFKSFDGDVDVKSKSNEFIGGETLPWLEWTRKKYFNLKWD